MSSLKQSYDNRSCQIINPSRGEHCTTSSSSQFSTSHHIEETQLIEDVVDCRIILVQKITSSKPRGRKLSTISIIQPPLSSRQSLQSPPIGEKDKIIKEKEMERVTLVDLTDFSDDQRPEEHRPEDSIKEEPSKCSYSYLKSPDLSPGDGKKECDPERLQPSITNENGAEFNATRPDCENIRSGDCEKDALKDEDDEISPRKVSISSPLSSNSKQCNGDIDVIPSLFNHESDEDDRNHEKEDEVIQLDSSDSSTGHAHDNENDDYDLVNQVIDISDDNDSSDEEMHSDDDSDFIETVQVVTPAKISLERKIKAATRKRQRQQIARQASLFRNDTINTVPLPPDLDLPPGLLHKQKQSMFFHNSLPSSDPSSDVPPDAPPLKHVAQLENRDFHSVNSTKCAINRKKCNSRNLFTSPISESHHKGKIRSQSKTASAPQKRKGIPYCYSYTEQDAKNEQERLFSESAARVRRAHEESQKRQKEGIFNNSKNTFLYPIDNVAKLPSNHWKWKDPYARLGLPTNSILSLVKKHYRRLCLLYHPDKFQSRNGGSGNAIGKSAGDTWEVKEVSDRFQAIKAAYEQLLEETESSSSSHRPGGGNN